MIEKMTFHSIYLRDTDISEEMFRVFFISEKNMERLYTVKGLQLLLLSV